MRPYLDFPTEEEDFMASLGRTRYVVHGEWDDYIVLFHEWPELPEEPEPETNQCPLCERVSATVKGLAVHLSRTHNVKSARADYFASRKEA